MPDFIPDGQFVPDSAPAAAGTPPSGGQPSFVPDSQFQPDDEKYGTTGQMIQTALEGGLRGATLGLSDVAGRALGEKPEDIKGRMEANPITSTVSQLAGAVAPIALTGGAAAPEEGALAGAAKFAPTVGLARTGKAVEGAFEGLGGGLPGRVLGMGLEGAGYGAGNAVSDAALGDPDLTAQKVMADIGMGAAFGSGLGALSKAVGTILPPAAQKLGDSLSNLKEIALGDAQNPSFLVKGASVPGGLASGQSPANWAQSFYEGLNKPDPNTTIRSLSKNLQDLYGSAKDTAKGIFEDQGVTPPTKPRSTYSGNPAHTNDAGFPEKQRFTNQAAQIIQDPSGRDLLAEKLGIEQPLSGPGTGGYEGQISPNRITGLQTEDPKAAEAYARSLQYIYKQDAVPWFRAHFSTEAGPDSMAGVRFTFKNPLDPSAEQKFLEALQDHLSPSAGYTKVNPNQLAVINFGGLEEPKFFDGLHLLHGGIGDELGIQNAESFRSTGDYGYVHDWKADPTGQRFPLPADPKGGSDLQGWLHDRGQVFEDLLQKNSSGEPLNFQTEQAKSFQNSLKEFQSTFMRRSNGGYTVDPAKVNSFFSRFEHVSQDAKKEILNNFITTAQDVAKSAENFHSFQNAGESISDRIESLAKKHQELTEVARAIRGQSAPNVNSRIGEVGLGYVAHSLGVSNPVVGGALATIEAYNAVKNPYELGATLSNTMAKLKVLGDMSEKVGNQIEKGARSIFAPNTERGVAVASMALAQNKYQKRVDRIEELTGNPQGFMNHLSAHTENLFEAAPNVSAGIQKSLLNSAAFLQSKIPRPSNPMVFSNKWQPSNFQKTQFNRYYRAVDDPLSALKDVKNGTLSSETMEALTAVHPQLLAEMRRKVFASIKPDKIPTMSYATKLSLSKLLGEPLDENMLPQAIQANQVSLSGPELGAQAAPKSGRKGATLGGLKELDLSSRSQTQTQKEEEEI